MFTKKSLKLKKAKVMKYGRGVIVKTGLAVGGGVAFIGGASAETINVTAITGILTDMGSIFPALGEMVVNIVPTLMILAVIGFIFKFFDKILAMVEKMV